MKRVYILIIMMTMIVVGTFADNTLYTWSSSNGTIIQAGGNITSTDESVECINSKVTPYNNSYYVLRVRGLDVEGSQDISSPYLEISLDNALSLNDTIIAEGFINNKGNENTTGLLVAAYSDGNRIGGAQMKQFPNIYYDSEMIDYGNDGEDPKELTFTVGENMAGANVLRLVRSIGSGEPLFLTKFVIKKYIKQPKLLSANPSQGSYIKGFAAREEMSFSTNYDDECDGFTVSVYENSESNEPMVEQITESRQDNAWVLKFPKEVTFYEGSTYIVKLQGYKGVEDVYSPLSFVYYGNTSYPYSDVTVSQSPSASTTIKDSSTKQATLTFSGSATISKVVIIDEDNNETTTTFAAANDEGTLWNVDLPQDILTNSVTGFTMRVYATDASGKIIGNAGGESGYLDLNFLCNIPRELTISPSNTEKFTSLTAFQFSYADGAKLIGDASKIVLASGNDTLKGTLSDDGMTYTLAEELTTPGKYTLSIPEGTFSLGKGYLNKAVSLVYEIKKASTDYNVTISPADGSTLSVLDEFTITFNSYEAGIVNNLYYYYPVLVDEKGDTVCKAGCEVVEAGTNKFLITLKSSVISEGTYTLKIPAECIYLTPKKNAVINYIPNDYMEFTYTVVPEAKTYGTVTLDPANGSEVKSLSSISVRFEDAFSIKVNNSSSSVSANVYKINDDSENEDTGIIATLAKSDKDGRKNLTITLSKEITAYGKYTFTIPKNSIYLAYLSGDKYNYELDMVFNYTVDPNASGIDTINVEEDDYVNVYTIQGVKVASGKRDDVTNGLKGLYIINGKKVVLK